MESHFWMSIRSVFWLLTIVLAVVHLPSAVSGYPTDLEGNIYTSEDEALHPNDDLSEDSVEQAELVSALLKMDNSGGHHRLAHRMIKRSESCHAESLENRILCERCAKYTKSHTVYTMCCDSIDNKVRTWCKNFLEYEFGLRN